MEEAPEQTISHNRRTTTSHLTVGPRARRGGLDIALDWCPDVGFYDVVRPRLVNEVHSFRMMEPNPVFLISSVSIHVELILPVNRVNSFRVPGCVKMSEDLVRVVVIADSEVAARNEQFITHYC